MEKNRGARTGPGPPKALAKKIMADPTTGEWAPATIYQAFFILRCNLFLGVYRPVAKGDEIEVDTPGPSWAWRDVDKDKLEISESLRRDFPVLVVFTLYNVLEFLILLFVGCRHGTSIRLLSALAKDDRWVVRRHETPSLGGEGDVPVG